MLCHQTHDFNGIPKILTEESMKIMSSYEHSLTYKMIISDFESLLHYAKNESLSNYSLVGTVGYCMSGPFVFRLAAEFDNVIKTNGKVCN